MPPRKHVPSLQNLCLSVISKHCRTNKNPFTSMPNQILDLIVNHADYAKNFSRQQFDVAVDLYTERLHITINRFTDRLDFTDQPSCITLRGVDLICLNTCENLTYLNLDQSTISITNLTRLSKSIPSIKQLSLRRTGTNDVTLSNIGKNCPNLRELDISECFYVTHYGLKALYQNGGKCRLIRDLSIIDTLIKDECAISILLNLPHLRRFDYQNTLCVIDAIFNRFVDTQKPEFKLEIINQTDEYRFWVTKSSIEAAVTLCPNVTCVTILGIKNTDSWMEDLSKFPKLENLSVAGSRKVRPATFERHIAPLLKLIGKNLEMLCLFGIRNINLLDIGIYCRKLKLLSLTKTDRFVQPTQYFSNQIFTQLNMFEIYCIPGVDIPSDQLDRFLSSCRNLHIFHLHQCQTLTDDLLNRVCEVNPFSELCFVDISHCDNVNACSILSLIRSCNLLSEVSYWKCAKIGISDHRKLQDFVRDQNLDLSLPTDP